MTFQLLVMIAILFSRNLTLTTVLMFFIGVCAVGRWTIAYVFLVEFYTTQHIKTLIPVVNASAALPLIFATFFVNTVTPNNALSIELMGIVLTIFSIIGGVLLLP